MKVYKFGGASIKDARGIRNLCDIVRQTEGDLMIVVSAIGKTTNALEQVVQSHHQLVDDLGIESLYNQLYDTMVTTGEIVSSLVVSRFLKEQGVENTWLDARTILATDNTYRHGVIDMAKTAANLKSVLSSNSRVYVIQGFIGYSEEGYPISLGREGSDYSAAVFANLLDADSLTVWKDVPGILTADPRRDPSATLIPELTYEEAARLAMSGAQILHPLTIAPLAEKNIPLYVKPFLDPHASGSVIK